MKMTFNIFAKKLFGTKYERLARTLFLYLIVFYGLRMAEFRVYIAPFPFYLTVSVFTAGVMWQALSSKDNAANMQNLFMLPFENRELVLSYTAALGVYMLWTKTAALLAVLLAVSILDFTLILGSVLCAVHAVLMSAAVYSLRKHRYAGGLWAAAVIAVIRIWGNQPQFILALAANGIVAVVLLRNADGYAFYMREGEQSRAVGTHTRHSVQRYLFRYLKYHRSYLLNIVMMWCAACVLPLFFKQMGSLSAAPVGFAILSLNTPVCILLSCDPALEQAVRFLPGQKKAFCIPYCLFVFSCNMTADVIFLCSLQLQNGGVTVRLIAAAVFFAMQSALLSVLLEWFYPIRGWAIESDLWRHPRKYIVPAIMLLLAGAVGTLPILLPILLVLLAAEVVILLFAALCL